MRTPIKGLIAAPFTPMHPDRSLMLETVPAFASLLHRNHIQGAFVCGTTGESLSLTPEERMAVAEKWVESSPKGFKVMVHVGDNCLEISKSLASHAQKIGAYAVGAMSPCFFRPTRLEDLVEFCAQVAGAAPKIPFYFYHIPSMTQVTFPIVEFLKQASPKIPNLAGAKFTCEDFMDFSLCKELDNGRFEMILGFDELLLCGLSLGAQSAIGSTYNFMAPLYNQLIGAFEKGDMKEASRLQRISMHTVRILRASGAFLGSSKAIMKLIGLDCGPVRLPVRALTESEMSWLKKELDSIGFFEVCCK